MQKPNGSVSQVEYAKRRGVSQPYISQLVKRGILPTLLGGRLDPAACDIAMAKIRPRVRSWSGAKSSPTQNSYLEARAVSEHYKARLLKLEYETMQGKLLDADRVLELTTSAFANCRTRLRALPKSLAPLVQNRSLGEVERILSDAVDGALTALSTDVLAPSDASESTGNDAKGSTDA
jgi:hypothetical protein